MKTDQENKIPTISALNENSVLLQFPEKVSLRLTNKIAKIAQHFQQELGQHITDHIPAYSSLLICFDSENTSIEKFLELTSQSLEHFLFNVSNELQNTETTKLIKLPVYYHPEVGLDLARLAEKKQLSIEELIQVHCKTSYTIYTVGFAPGFAYMGNVDKRITEPRLATPRSKVPKGSVGIAGMQTGIYPQASPGGWNIVGSCPKQLFHIDAEGQAHCLYKTGDRVQFYPISRNQFLEQGGRI